MEKQCNYLLTSSQTVFAYKKFSLNYMNNIKKPEFDTLVFSRGATRI